MLPKSMMFRCIDTLFICIGGQISVFLFYSILFYSILESFSHIEINLSTVLEIQSQKYTAVRDESAWSSQIFILSLKIKTSFLYRKINLAKIVSKTILFSNNRLQSIFFKNILDIFCAFR
jgi:hypothetical protein